MWRATMAIVLCLLISGPVLAQRPTERLTSALEEMHAWVGDGENGQRWKRFLKSEALASQISLGENASRRELAQILERYSGDTPGLDRWRFVAVRDGLEHWYRQLPIGSEQWAAAAKSPRGGFLPVTEADVSESAEQLNSAVDQLGSFLNSGDSENATKWQRFLHWETLQSQIEIASRPNFVALQRALNAFYGPHVGLELPQFTQVRTALRNYMNAALFRHQPPTEEVFTERLAELARRLRAYDQGEDGDDAQLIGRTIGWLDSGNQSGDLVTQVRQRYGQPNLYGQVSAKLVGIGIAEQVNLYQDVSEVILGTSLYGRAHTQGEIGMKLVPSTERAIFDIEMTGFATSDNVGYNGPVTVHTTGHTQIFSRKRVYLDVLGLRADPAVASCSTNSQINSIAARSKLVRRIAWKRAGRTKTQSEQIASYRAQLRVARQIDDRAAEPLQESNDRFQEQVRKPLTRFDAFPRQVSFQTDDDFLHLQVMHASPYQIATAVGPPPLEQDCDMAVRVHESLVSNFAESMLGGRTVTDEQLVEILSDAGAEVPPELEPGPDKDPWSVSFAPSQPIRAEFGSGTVRLGIRGRRFTRGEQVVRNNIEIAATYQLQRDGNGIRLTRVGEVEVEYMDLESLSIAQVAMKAFLRTKFEAMFEPEIVSDGLVLPGQWQKAGALRLIELAADKNWLKLGWRVRDDSMRTASMNRLSAD